MEPTPAPHPHPSPHHIEEKGKLRRYSGIFAGAFVRTMAVVIGLSIALVGVGLVSEWGQKASCNVAVRTMHGELFTSYTGGGTDSGALVRQLAKDEDDPAIKAVILDIDSPGGVPVSGEEIAEELTRMQKPTIAIIRSLGASAAYWAATGADRIYASPSSDIGSIGVAVSFPDESEKNQKDGVVFNEFASGKFKNLGSPNHAVTPDEEAILKRDIDLVYKEFIDTVAHARNLSVDKVKALADGSTVTGRSAKEAGLIDEIGGYTEAKEYLKTVMKEKPVFCEPDAGEIFSY